MQKLVIPIPDILTQYLKHFLKNHIAYCHLKLCLQTKKSKENDKKHPKF